MGRLMIVALLAWMPLTLPATDTLKAFPTTLGANWTATFGAVTDWVESGTDGAGCTVSGADYCSAYWNADSFTSDQYSQAKINFVGTNGFQAVGVRLQGNSGSHSGYFVSLESGCTIYKYVNTGSTRTAIGSCSDTWTNGHTLKISVSGSNITAYDNGVQIGSATDSSVTGGSPGILNYPDGAGGGINTWQGDNVSGGAIFPIAILNTPFRCCR